MDGLWHHMIGPNDYFPCRAHEGTCAKADDNRPIYICVVRGVMYVVVVVV